MRKRSICLLLSIVLIISAFYINVAGDISEDTVFPVKTTGVVQGKDFTDIPALAEKLDEIFAGDINIWYGGKKVSMPLGWRSLNKHDWYTKTSTGEYKNIGTGCYAYANAVYNTLFDFVVLHGDTDRKNVNVIPKGTKSVSYQMFLNAGVKPGANIRTTPNRNGNFYGDDGHSMILLKYDKDYIYVIDGNGDGKGDVSIRKFTWTKFNTNGFLLGGRTICFVIQPTNKRYEELYGNKLAIEDIIAVGVKSNRATIKVKLNQKAAVKDMYIFYGFSKKNIDKVNKKTKLNTGRKGKWTCLKFFKKKKKDSIFARDLSNLKKRKKYYYKVVCIIDGRKYVSKMGSFKTVKKMKKAENEETIDDTINEIISVDNIQTSDNFEMKEEITIK